MCPAPLSGRLGLILNFVFKVQFVGQTSQVQKSEPHTPDIFVYLEQHFIILEVSIPSTVWIWIEGLRRNNRNRTNMFHTCQNPQ